MQARGQETLARGKKPNAFQREMHFTFHRGYRVLTKIFAAPGTEKLKNSAAEPGTEKGGGAAYRTPGGEEG